MPGGTSGNTGLRRWRGTGTDGGPREFWFAGYFDNVVVSTTSATTAYDFEALPADKSECKGSGYTEYGFPNLGMCVSAVEGNESNGR